MVKIKNDEIDLLIDVWIYLNAEGNRKDLAAALKRTVDRLTDEREKEYLKRQKGGRER